MASITAWQTTLPTYEHITRLATVFDSLIVFSLQLPFLGFDTIFRSTFYSQRLWRFKNRSLTRLLSHNLWSLNPATRPLADLQSYDARKNQAI